MTDMTDMTDKERAAFDLGWAHGADEADAAYYGYGPATWKAYPTEAEQEAYNLGRRNGFNSID